MESSLELGLCWGTDSHGCLFFFCQRQPQDLCLQCISPFPPLFSAPQWDFREPKTSGKSTSAEHFNEKCRLSWQVLMKQIKHDQLPEKHWRWWWFFAQVAHQKTFFAKQSRLHTASDLQSWRLALHGALQSSSCLSFIWDVVLSNLVLVEQRSWLYVLHIICLLCTHELCQTGTLSILVLVVSTCLWTTGS